MPKTKITATPKPKAVFTFLDTAKNEHIPKKYANIMLSIKIERIPMLIRFSILMLSVTVN